MDVLTGLGMESMVPTKEDIAPMVPPPSPPGIDPTWPSTNRSSGTTRKSSRDNTQAPAETGTKLLQTAFGSPTGTGPQARRSQAP